MPITAEELALQLDDLDRMIASGVTRASYDGRSIEYASMTDLRRARDELLRRLGLAPRVRRTVARYRSGNW